jgi:hypothetical protein
MVIYMGCEKKNSQESALLNFKRKRKTKERKKKKTKESTKTIYRGGSVLEKIIKIPMY